MSGTSTACTGPDARLTVVPGRPRSIRQPMPRLVLTIRDLARCLKVSELTVRRYIKQGRVSAIQIGGTWRVPTLTRERLEQVPELCTLRQVANLLDVSDVTVRRWVRQRVVPAVKGRSSWTVRRDDLLALLAPGDPSVDPLTLSA